MNETATIEHDVADLGLAEAGRLRVEWAERSMPVLRQLRERFAAERPLEGVRHQDFCRQGRGQRPLLRSHPSRAGSPTEHHDG